jgi:ribose 5-phosphate isomerase A
VNKGGGACHFVEKLVASAAKRFVVVADDRKNQKTLGSTWKQGVPLEVTPLAYRLVMLKVSKLGGKPVLRMCSTGKAGPVVTDNGNFVIDADFGLISNPAELNASLLNISGIIETGLFVDMAAKCYFGTSDGKVVTTEKPR